MSKASQAGNSVVSAAETVCGMYRVPVIRMQSRVVTVVGGGGRQRPMFMGKWTDDDGVEHTKGMADLLTMPTVRLGCQCEPGTIFEVTVPLWVECKAGSGTLSKEQRAFRDYVVSAGAGYLELRDSADALLAWFEQMKVEKR